jgi:capsular polysaccharide biosynthesis protein
VFRKLLEAFFRHKLLVLLPPVLIPAIVSPIAFLSLPPVYETSVSVWIDRPAYLNTRDGTNAWVSAVQTQSGRLSELLRTRAFLTDVVQRTSLAPLAGSPAGLTRLAEMITRDVTIGSAGTMAGPATTSEHLLVIRVQGATAQVAYELCKAIVDAYQEKTSADQADQAGVAVDFYTSRLQDSQQQLNKAGQDLRRYAAIVQSNSSETSQPDAASGLTAAMLDPKLGALQSNLQAAQLDVHNAQAALNQAQQDAMMAEQGQQFGFQVLDAPQVATAATAQIKKIIIYPIAALVVGLGLTGMLLVLLVASDRSVRSEQDLAPGLRVLGTVPMLQLKRVPKKLRSVATRRAMGAPAGMALPLPGGAK